MSAQSNISCTVISIYAEAAPSATANLLLPPCQTGGKRSRIII